MQYTGLTEVTGNEPPTYNCVGTNDTVKSRSINMANEMLSRSTFTPEHYVFYQKDGGYHDFNTVQEYLYNALPLFLRTKF